MIKHMIEGPLAGVKKCWKNLTETEKFTFEITFYRTCIRFTSSEKKILDFVQKF